MIKSILILFCKIEIISIILHNFYIYFLIIWHVGLEKWKGECGKMGRGRVRNFFSVFSVQVFIVTVKKDVVLEGCISRTYF